MPTQSPTGARRHRLRTAQPGLFARLVDDAAVFPPGNAPLDRAVRGHRVHRTAWYAALVGPLLVPASAAGDLLAVLGADPAVEHGAGDAAPVLEVVLIARPGTDTAVVVQALDVLAPAPSVAVVGVEAGWTPGWRDLDVGGLPLALEVPRGREQEEPLDDIALAHSDGADVQAKFRTGATAAWAWPDEFELADFLRAVADRDLPFKLTGGLHHAVRADHGAGADGPGGAAGTAAPEPQHGLLNVLLATAAARDGAEPDELAGLLGRRDPEGLADTVRGIDAATATGLRAGLTAYGCCGVTDPVTDLTALHLIEEPNP